MELFSAYRMAKAERRGVKPQTTRRIGPGPVFFIAHDRATDVSQVNPDLVTAAGFQGELHQGKPGGLFKDPIVSDGMPGPFGSGPDLDVVGIGLIL